MSQAIGTLRVVVADDERDTREFLQELLPRLGHQVAGVAETGEQLVEQCHSAKPDLIITDIKMPGLDGIDAAKQATSDHEAPVILVSAHHDVELIVRSGEDHVMAYLVKPIKPADLETAIYLAVLRFEHYRKLSQEAASLRQALEDRKVIERAKGVLMKRGRMDEPDAFRRLQRLASDKNMKLVEAARTILTAEEAFHPPSDTYHRPPTPTRAPDRPSERGTTAP